MPLFRCGENVKAPFEFSFVTSHSGNTYNSTYTFNVPISGYNNIEYSFTGAGDVNPSIVYTIDGGTPVTITGSSQTMTGNITIPSNAANISIVFNTNRQNTAGRGSLSFA